MTHFDLGNTRPVVRVCIAKDEIFWGPGVRDLLLLIQTTNSVRLACTQMNMSYSKGWKLINNLEDRLGFRVVNRKQGGKSGGEAHLTPEGKDILVKFEAYEKDCQEAALEIFKKHFE